MVFAYHSHNMYIEFLLCFGIVGIALMAAYLIKCFAAIKKSPHKAGGYIAVMAAIICTLAVSGVTDVVIMGVETSLMAMFVLAAVGIYEKRESSADGEIE